MSFINHFARMEERIILSEKGRWIEEKEREEKEWKEREERGKRMEGEHEEMKRSSLIQSVSSLSPLLSSHEYSWQFSWWWHSTYKQKSTFSPSLFLSIYFSLLHSINFFSSLYLFFPFSFIDPASTLSHPFMFSFLPTSSLRVHIKSVFATECERGRERKNSWVKQRLVMTFSTKMYASPPLASVSFWQNSREWSC